MWEDLLWNILKALIVIGFASHLKMLYDDNYFKNRGIKSIPVKVPMFGNFLDVILKKEHFADFMTRIYKKFPDEKFAGGWQFTKPFYMIKDLEVAKMILVKDFDHFQDRPEIFPRQLEPFMGKSLVSLTGRSWHNMRGILSPAFTASKMRIMFELLTDVADEMVNSFKHQLKTKDLLEIEMKSSFTKYANDVIASNAFGIKVNSFESENEFFVKTRDISNISGWKIINMLMMINLPVFISKFLGLKIFNPESTNFFKDLVLKNMKERDIKKIIRPDMIQLLMDAKSGKLKHETTADAKEESGFATVKEEQHSKHSYSDIKLEDDDIVAQAIIFLVAGFDTTSTVLAFMIYELARNPEIQEKLQQEIDEMAEKNDGKLKYADLGEMKYMDMVVSELLRYWPPGVALSRICVKPYKLPAPNESSTEIQLEKGDLIFVPLYSIHHDPLYYPDPEKFDPERFSDENKTNINSTTYLPFGLGPRNCIGSRFALMEVKAAVFYLLRHFDFVVTQKTQIPLVLSKNTFNLLGENGIWVGVKERKM